MSTSLLYHTQGTYGYQYQKAKRVRGVEIYYMHSSAKSGMCPKCRSWDISFVETGRTRDIRGLCIGLKKRFCASPCGELSVLAAGLHATNRSRSAPARM